MAKREKTTSSVEIKCTRTEGITLEVEATSEDEAVLLATEMASEDESLDWELLEDEMEITHVGPSLGT
jgi:hypothetical protein